jgi:predicted P-loop ATPase
MSLNDDNDDKIVSLVSRAGRKSTRKAKVLASIDFGDITAAGAIKATCANTRIAIGKLEISCGYDVFHDKPLIGGQPIGQHAGELSDHACLVLRKLVDDKFGFDPGRNHVFDACVQLALENSFDPVVDYLDGLEWDGTPRIDEWLTTYLGAADTKLNSVIGRIALIAQVRRARSPGCKFDQIIVLESAEGELKSSALSVLAGGPENFSDQTILGRGDKEQQELLRGVWVYEIADLSNIRKAEVEDVKAFASRTYDRARPAYGRCRIDLPRRGVIWATTNNSEYLKSQTGNRRFWPIPVAVIHPIDLDSLARDRDQLLAEAAYFEAAGASIVLPQELWSAAAEEQEQRREADPWEDVLRSVNGVVCPNEKSGKPEERIHTQELLLKVGIPIDRQKNQDTKRVGEAMRTLRWSGPKMIRIGEKNMRGYWRAPETEEGLLHVAAEHPQQEDS